MSTAQDYLNQKYPQGIRKEVKIIDLSGWNESSWTAKPNWTKLTGELNLSDFPNLEKLDCSNNQLTSLNLTNCPNLTELKCWENELTQIKFPNSQLPLKTFYAWTNHLTKLDWKTFNSESLTNVSISNNNFQQQDISLFDHFPNLEELCIGNDLEERLTNKIYNRFTGSVKSLQNLTKLKKLQIEGTYIEEKIEYLPKGLQIVSWGKEAVIKRLGLSKEETTALRKTNQNNFSEILGKIVTNYVKLNAKKREKIEKLSDAINSGRQLNHEEKEPEDQLVTNFKKLEKELKEFNETWAEIVKEDKKNNMIASIIPLERLYVIRGNIKQFLKKWGTKKENEPSELSKLRSPDQLWKYRWAIYSTQFLGRGLAVAGTVLTFQDQGAIGGGILAVYPFTELAVSKLEEKLKNKEDKWKEFLNDADIFLDNYHELMGIIAPFKAGESREGIVSEALENLNKNVNKLLKTYDEDNNQEIDISELVTERHKLAEDLNQEKSEVQAIIDDIKKLEEAIIEYRKLAYKLNYYEETIAKANNEHLKDESQQTAIDLDKWVEEKEQLETKIEINPK